MIQNHIGYSATLKQNALNMREKKNNMQMVYTKLIVTNSRCTLLTLFIQTSRNMRLPKERGCPAYIFNLFVWLELVLEESPKWKVLKDVLEDIDKENASNETGRIHEGKVRANYKLGIFFSLAIAWRSGRWNVPGVFCQYTFAIIMANSLIFIFDIYFNFLLRSLLTN